jgi:hypothetical protein
MKNAKPIYLIILYLIFLTGCAKSSSLVDFVKEGGLETSGLVNLALAANGARVTVSNDNPDHPADTLINGITSSENWGQGEGWETSYEGRFARGGYLAYGVEDPYMAEERGLNESFDSGDESWRGLRLETSRGTVNSALGWVIIDFPEEKTVNRAIIHTIDSEEYPAEKFGVSDLMLQYWSRQVNSWAVVERLGKGIGQAGNVIHDNKSGVITVRFQPVETSRMRLVIRWTNDSKRYTRGYYTYSNGTIRLVEIEIYGYERTEVSEEEVVATTEIKDVNKIAEIEIVIDNYVDGYNKRNADMLMSSISPEYSRDGETYSDLRKRMESIFADYQRVELKLQNLGIKLSDKGATATSSYTSEYQAIDGKSTPINASGALIFELSEATGNWKITRIDSQ